MGERKLTKAQMDVLERLGRGDVLLCSTGRYASVSWKGSAERALDPRTTHALYKLGLTKQAKYGHPLSVGLYQIELTDAGRSALEASK